MPAYGCALREYGERRPGGHTGGAGRGRRACHGLPVAVAAIGSADRELERAGHRWQYLTNQDDHRVAADEPESLARSEALRREARAAVTAWLDACL
jgi:hypothetical protein